MGCGASKSAGETATGVVSPVQHDLQDAGNQLSGGINNTIEEQKSKVEASVEEAKDNVHHKVEDATNEFKQNVTDNVTNKLTEAESEAKAAVSGKIEGLTEGVSNAGTAAISNATDTAATNTPQGGTNWQDLIDSVSENAQNSAGEASSKISQLAGNFQK